MARVQIDERKLKSFVRGEMTTRARAALGAYRAIERQYQSASNPFAKGPGPRRTSIKTIPDGIRIIAESPGAVPFEVGNDPRGDDASGDFIEPKTKDNLWLRLKDPKGRGLVNPERARIQKGKDGKYYLVVKRVRTYSGRHALRRSVLSAFGLPPR